MNSLPTATIWNMTRNNRPTEDCLASACAGMGYSEEDYEAAVQAMIASGAVRFCEIDGGERFGKLCGVERVSGATWKRNRA